jgi:hypothetical protein
MSTRQQLLTDYDLKPVEVNTDSGTWKTRGAQSGQWVELFVRFEYEDYEHEVTVLLEDEYFTCNLIELKSYDDATLRAILNVWTFKGEGG